MKNIYIKKIKKIIEFVYMKKFFFSQKYYGISENKKMSYVFQKNHKSKELIIVFSACTRLGIKGRYNYIRTLKNIDANKLFILDDFGYDYRGLFYLGENNQFEVALAVKKLIEKIANKYNLNNRFYVGSSKGGFASLYFGLEDTNSTIIVGAPQYYLAYYLNDAKDIERLNQITGGDDIANLNLDNIIKEKIYSSGFNGEIFLHYSTEEHTYEEHIIDLLKDIKSMGIPLEIEEKKYKNHGDVGIYFSEYLVNILMKK